MLVKIRANQLAGLLSHTVTFPILCNMVAV